MYSLLSQIFTNKITLPHHHVLHFTSTSLYNHDLYMTSLSLAQPSTPIPFPTIPTATWSIAPQIHKRRPNIFKHRKQKEQTWMAPRSEQDDQQQQPQSPPQPVQTGPEHWEEQRRRWTQGLPVTSYTDDDVLPPYIQRRFAGLIGRRSG